MIAIVAVSLTSHVDNTKTPLLDARYSKYHDGWIDAANMQEVV